MAPTSESAIGTQLSQGRAAQGQDARCELSGTGGCLGPSPLATAELPWSRPFPPDCPCNFYAGNAARRGERDSAPLSCGPRGDPGCSAKLDDNSVHRIPSKGLRKEDGPPPHPNLRQPGNKAAKVEEAAAAFAITDAITALTVMPFLK